MTMLRAYKCAECGRIYKSVWNAIGCRYRHSCSSEHRADAPKEGTRMKEATTELLNQKRIKEILKSGGAKTVSAEAVAWIGAVAREAAKNLAQSGRRTPGGRLMAPKFAPSLMARQAALPPEPALGEGALVVQEAVPTPVSGIVENHPEWDEYNDWQQQVRLGKTRLPYEEWKKENGK